MAEVSLGETLKMQSKLLAEAQLASFYLRSLGKHRDPLRIVMRDGDRDRQKTLKDSDESTYAGLTSTHKQILMNCFIVIECDDWKRPACTVIPVCCRPRRV